MTFVYSRFNPNQNTSKDSSEIIIMHLSLIVLFCVAALSGCPAHASVDETRPDLSVFKLRRVDTAQLARKRADQPILDLATGAVHMHQSFLTAKSQVKCPAYSHLFRLIKRQVEGEDRDKKRIRMDTVESLAVVVRADIQLYQKLMEQDKGANSVLHFMEAIELLERDQTQDARDTWLDLLECLGQFMPGRLSSPKVVEFLREPKRAASLATLRSFKAIPVEERPKAGRVAELVKLYECLAPSESAYEKSNKIIASLDDEQTAAARREFQESSKPVQINADCSETAGETLSQAEPAPQVQLSAQIEPQTQIVHPDSVDLIVPSEQPSAEVSSSKVSNEESSSATSEVQLAIMNFIKMRLQSQQVRRLERMPRMSMQLAFDYMSHWQDLSSARLNPNNKLDRQAIEFVNDPNNRLLTGRIQEAIEKYNSITEVLHEMSQQEDRYEHIDQLREPLERLSKLLDDMDGSFDVDDLRRIHAIWKSKWANFSTLDQFINSEQW